MCKGLIGKKLGMTGLFTPEGKYIPVTVIELGPCVVTQVKSKATDGYDALQLGFGTKKAKRITKPLAGHMKKSNGQFAVLREVAVEAPESYDVGQSISLDLFAVGERVDIVGTTKGRGFAGVTKRHGFRLGRKTHGSKSYRIPGSIGCSAYPAKVIRGKKMPGQYGNTRKTARNLEVVDIRPADNLILVKGAVPGFNNGLVMVNKLKF
ncbi:MAG: 50S ribosomal protein L3 [Desulfobacterales bacterium]|nr:50S ribosomal protein L3 [Desulfobacterales bacterium]